jgi:hypothetical protein
MFDQAIVPPLQPALKTQMQEKAGCFGRDDRLRKAEVDLISVHSKEN